MSPGKFSYFSTYLGVLKKPLIKESSFLGGRAPFMGALLLSKMKQRWLNKLFNQKIIVFYEDTMIYFEIFSS